MSQIYYQASDGSFKPWVDASGAALVSTMPGGVVHIKSKLALDGTAVTFDFSATPIIAFVLIVTNDTAGTAQLPATAVYCIDPSNDTVRDAWLTESTSLVNDVQSIPLVTGTTDKVRLTSAIDYIGIKRADGTETLRVTCIGVAA